LERLLTIETDALTPEMLAFGLGVKVERFLPWRHDPRRKRAPPPY